MDPTDKQALADALGALIEAPDAETIFTQLHVARAVSDSGVPVRLVGRAAVLNPLLDLMDNDVAYAKVMNLLVGPKRDERGLDPLQLPATDMLRRCVRGLMEPDDTGRRAYMRNFMAAKRDRERRIVEIANLLRSEHDRLRGVARMEFCRLHAARWMAVKEQREAELRKGFNGRLPQNARSEMADRFWADVDAELDEFEEFARAEMRKPLHQRAPGGFRFRLQPREKQ